MNPLRRIVRVVTFPFRSAIFTVVLVFALTGYTVWRIAAASQARRARIAPAAQTAQTPASGQASGPQAPADQPPSDALPPPPQNIVRTLGSNYMNLVLPEQPEQPGATRPVIPKRVQDAMLTRPIPISRDAYRPSPKPAAPAPPPVYFLPAGRRIRCWLANAIESGSTEIPVIGYVAEDVHTIDRDGVTRTVIPAGVEVHSVAQMTGMRDRVIVNGRWMLVWRNADPRANGRTLHVQGLALARDYDERTGIFGPRDGSPGILGDRLTMPDDAQIRSLALRFVSATTRALEDQQQTLNPLTNQMVSTPKASMQNALMEGFAETTSAVSTQIDRIRETLERDSVYLAVLPGTQFYIYTKEPIDLSQATMPGGSAQPPAPQSRTTQTPLSAVNIASSP